MRILPLREAPCYYQPSSLRSLSGYFDAKSDSTSPGLPARLRGPPSCNANFLIPLDYVDFWIHST